MAFPHSADIGMRRCPQGGIIRQCLHAAFSTARGLADGGHKGEMY